MKNKIYTRLAKSNWHVDEFGLGKTPNAKRIAKRFVKKRANRLLTNLLKKE